MEITINQNDNQTIRLQNTNIQDIGINENDNQVIGINNNSPQDITLRQNDNQTILIDGGGAVIGITDVLVNGITVVSGNIAYVIVPTKTSDLINDSGFLTSETDPTVPSYVKAISLADINNWNSKQNELVSGSTIKTINSESLLGSGNITITGTQYTAGTGIDITNDIISNEITSYNDLTDLPTIPTNTSELINDSDYVSENELSEVAFTGGYGSLSNTPEYLSDFINDGEDGTHKFISDYSNQNIKGIGWYSNKWGIVNGDNLLFNALQDELVSGTNIKTINSTSLLGSGDISISVPTKTSDLTNNGEDGTHPFISNYNPSTDLVLKAQITGGNPSLDFGVPNAGGTAYVYSTLQNELVSGTNIKTINNESLLGSGNINITESGTFTPSIDGNVTSATITYSLQEGKYTKIGNVIYYDFKLIIDNISGGSGLIKIVGIPYLNNINTYGANIGNVMCLGDIFGNNNIRTLWSAGNELIISDINNGIGGLSISNTTSTNYLYCSGFFMIT